MLGYLFLITQVYGTPNPATPGGYGGPYTPNTPGGGMYGSEPSYSPYTQSPSPAGFGNPMTPGSIAPVSPAYNPLTPGAGMEETQADWVTTDIEVRINENHEVSWLKVILICCQVTLRRSFTLVIYEGILDSGLYRLKGKCNYSGSPSIRSPIGHEYLAVLTGGRVKGVWANFMTGPF